MDMERHPSGISFDVRGCYAALSSPKQGVEESQTQDFRTPYIPVAGEQHRRYLPLLQISQDVKVIGHSSRTLLAQTFVNSSTVAIQEANYCFPLYDGSVIISFRCWLDGKNLLEGEVKPKAAAKAEYRDAVARQRVAALLEEHTPEIFETVVGNIPPQTVVKVEITYVNELKADNGGDGMLVTIPTSIAPRYGTPPTGYPTSTSSSPRTVENGLKIQIEVSASLPIQKLENPTHPISVELGSEGHPTRAETFGKLGERGFDPKKARASLSDRNAVLGKDFVLLIVASSSHLCRVLVECHPNLPDHSVVMTTIIPQEMFAAHLSPKATNAEIIFVADRSGSMLGKMDALISALQVLLERIPELCLFNICSFGSQHSLLWPRSRSPTSTNLGHAKKHLLTSFRADLGGTELLPALETVVRQRMTSEDLRTEVILLTDGEVWNTEATIDFVRTSRSSANDKIRFFALGIGNAVSHSLVEGIGRQGGGYAEVVAVDANGAWESRVIRMLNGALTPSSWQCKVSLEPEIEPYLAQIGGGTESNSDIQTPVIVQAPFHIPTLHAFSRLSVFFIINRKMSLETSVKIQALASTGETATYLLPLEKVEGRPTTIHYLAAKALMNDFEAEQSWLHSEHDELRKRDSTAFDEIVRSEAESLGRKWSITGKWTSFIAVNHNEKLENVVSIYRAERSNFSELAAPLRVSTRRRLATSSADGETATSYTRASRTSFESYGVSTMPIAHSMGEQARSTTPKSMDRDFENAEVEIPTPMPVIKTAEEILTSLIDNQSSLGYFPLTNIRDGETVLKSFRVELLEKLSRDIFELNEGLVAQIFLFETVLVTIFIEKRLSDLIQLWELPVKKANDWVREEVKDGSVREKLYSLVLENFLEELLDSDDECAAGHRGKIPWNIQWRTRLWTRWKLNQGI